MKSLTTHIAEKLVVNQQFDEKLIVNQRFDEKLIVNKSFKDNTIKVVSKQQLGGIIYKRLAENPEELYLNDLDVSSIKDFSGIFSSYIFRELIKTKKICIDEWNTESAKNMNSMFQSCRNLKEVDVSNFDVSNVTSMEYMFRKCKSLKELDLTNWKVNRVRDMEKMFYQCESLKTIGNVSKWEPESLIMFDNAFNGCKNLKNVDISKWSEHFLNDVSSTDAFNDCRYIQIPDWAER